MTPSKSKVLILFLVLAVAATTLAGWTWDDNGPGSGAPLAQQPL